MLLTALCVTACGKQSGTSPGPDGGDIDKYEPGVKPKPPFDVAAPPVPSAQLDGKNLEKIDPEDLAGEAMRAAEAGDYARAIQLQHWAVARAGASQYNLACFYGQKGEVDAALYWLQRAALEEGVDAGHAILDEDLVKVRRDSRWRRINAFLAACNTYWSSSDLTKTTLVVPTGYKKGTPITTIVWLHGMGSVPEGLVSDALQPTADRLKFAFVGVSGTLPRGPHSFVWAENPERDGKRIADALKEVSDRVTVKPGFVIAMGFSQGAGVGLEVAVRDPETYAGAIVMSSGVQRSLQLNGVPIVPDLKKRGFILTIGGNELPGNKQQYDEAVRWLTSAGAKVMNKSYPGMGHSLPPDFDRQLPAWIAFIEKAR
jgi:predicted esterase